jgi:hypothetical protein
MRATTLVSRPYVTHRKHTWLTANTSDSPQTHMTHRKHTWRKARNRKTADVHNVPYQAAVDCIWNVMAHAQKRDFVFRRNERVHLNRRWASVQSTTGTRGVRISGSNAGYIMFRCSVKSTGYPLHSSVYPSLPLPAPPCAITFQPDSNSTRKLKFCFFCEINRILENSLLLRDMTTNILLFF